MKHHEILIGGFGGQGILFLGRVIATAGMLEGYEVSWFPSYGPEMRGGTANCTVIISEEQIGATVVDHPTACIAMNTPSFLRFTPSVRQEGLVVMNSSLVTEDTVPQGVRLLKVPANDLAWKEVGIPETMNMVILGALLAYSPILEFEHAKKALQLILEEKKKTILDANVKALEAGALFVQKGGKERVS